MVSISNWTGVCVFLTLIQYIHNLGNLVTACLLDAYSLLSDSAGVSVLWRAGRAGMGTYDI